MSKTIYVIGKTTLYDTLIYLLCHNVADFWQRNDCSYNRCEKRNKTRATNRLCRSDYKTLFKSNRIRMKIKIFKRKKKKFMYETLLNPKPRIGLIRRQNIEVVSTTESLS